MSIVSSEWHSCNSLKLLPKVSWELRIAPGNRKRPAMSSVSFCLPFPHSGTSRPKVRTQWRITKEAPTIHRGQRHNTSCKCFKYFDFPPCQIQEMNMGKNFHLTCLFEVEVCRINRHKVSKFAWELSDLSVHTHYNIDPRKLRDDYWWYMPTLRKQTWCLPSCCRARQVNVQGEGDITNFLTRKTKLKKTRSYLPDS